MPHCANCGKEISSGTTFCQFCGAKQTPSQSVPVHVEKLNYEIKYKPSYSLLEVQLQPSELVRAEAGAMTYMSSNIQVNTHMREKSFLGTLKLSFLGGQSFFVNDYVAVGAPGRIGLVSAPIGDIQRLEVGPGKEYIVQKSAYIASAPSVDLDTQWQGFTKGLFGTGLFMVKTTGQGDLFINTFGAIDQHTLGPGETFVVDNFHLVAFSDTCQYTVRKFGNLKSTLLGGEGLVTDIVGPGEVYLQTKNLSEFGDWLWTVLEPKVMTAHPGLFPDKIWRIKISFFVLLETFSQHSLRRVMSGSVVTCKYS
jgi:uncharacterized protein (TIGR00266 family)